MCLYLDFLYTVYIQLCSVSSGFQVIGLLQTINAVNNPQTVLMYVSLNTPPVHWKTLPSKPKFWSVLLYDEPLGVTGHVYQMTQKWSRRANGHKSRKYTVYTIIKNISTNPKFAPPPFFFSTTNCFRVRLAKIANTLNDPRMILSRKCQKHSVSETRNSHLLFHILQKLTPNISPFRSTTRLFLDKVADRKSQTHWRNPE